MRKILTYPIVFLLSIKCGLMGVLLKMAQEQTQDAAALNCPNCHDSGSGCANKHNCCIQRLKDREQVIWAEIIDIRKRVAKLRGV